jgi:hypothetical protein
MRKEAHRAVGGDTLTRGLDGDRSVWRTAEGSDLLTLGNEEARWR